ncbi:helix-turn-helix domain-containing protein [Phascolarctobacterium succinatutens]|uniref:helix-turn-helix domain-containing protein n=1 Tax=Phascolarctobacterium succinatutens TaxID=626940 RepID=UPI0026EFBAD6|nr:helix-turn-helix transcriptional regulator [Phascolarctobacterium succinatutens]
MMPADEIKRLFSINLKRIMLENGKTQSDIVKDLSFRQATVSDWLNGKKYPRMDKIEMLAQYFRISIDELISVSKQEKMSLSSLELALIKKYRQLSASDKQEILNMIDFKLFQYTQYSEQEENYI